MQEKTKTCKCMQSKQSLQVLLLMWQCFSQHFGMEGINTKYLVFILFTLSVESVPIRDGWFFWFKDVQHFLEVWEAPRSWPHVVQAALLVRNLTFLCHLEFLSSSLTLSFKGDLCFAEVLLTPHAQRLCLELFQSKSSSQYLAPAVSNTCTFVFVTVNDRNSNFLFLVGYTFYYFISFLFFFFFLRQILEFW